MQKYLQISCKKGKRKKKQKDWKTAIRRFFVRLQFWPNMDSDSISCLSLISNSQHIIMIRLLTSKELSVHMLHIIYMITHIFIIILM